MKESARNGDTARMREWRLLLPALRRSRGKLSLAALAVLLVSVSSLLYPLLLKSMIDEVTGTRAWEIERPALLLAALAAVFVLAATAGYFVHVATNEIGFRLRNDLRVRFFESLLLRPLSFHRTQQTGELSARAVEDIGRLQPIFSGLAAPALQQALVVAGCLVLMWLLHPVMTAIAVGIMLLPVPALFFSGRRILRDFTESSALHAQANALFEESLVGVREVQTFAREHEQASRYGTLHEEAFHGELRATRRQAGMQQSVSLLLAVVLLGVFFVWTSKAAIPGWSVSAAVAFYLYAYTMAMASVSLGRVYLAWQGIAGALGRTSALFASVGFNSTSPKGTHRSAVRGDVAFRDVSFAYTADAPVFERFSFSVDAGEWLLVEGASGCGKSTIAALLAGLYSPQRGEVLVDGVALREWDRAHLLACMGIVAQEPVLFHGTLRENILFAPGARDELRLRAVVDTACIDSFLSDLPDGLDTVVGERGYTLSGGQKSRIAIARALFLDPAILILDEANAMLEAELETLLWQRLRAHRSGKTTIILTHHTSRIPLPYTHLDLTSLAHIIVPH